MIYSPLSQADYVALVIEIISDAEGEIPKVKNVGDGLATIGYGYTFNRNDNVALWQAAGISLTATELARLAAIALAPIPSRARQPTIC